MNYDEINFVSMIKEESFRRPATWNDQQTTDFIQKKISPFNSVVSHLHTRYCTRKL